MSRSNYFKIFFWLFYFILLVFAGMSVQRIWTVWIGMLFSLLSILLLIVAKVSIEFPTKFLKYSVFLLFFIFSLFWSNNLSVSYPYFLMFLTGGFLWILFYNLRKKDKRVDILLINILLVLGIVFGTMFIIQRFTGVLKVSSFGLNGYTSFNFNHHHVGDLLAVVLVAVVYKLVFKKDKRNFWLAFLLLGGYTMLVSGSRSAIVALAGTLIYLLSEGKVFETKRRGFVYVILGLLLVSFLFVSRYKNLVLSREYYFQSIYGLFKYPMGVGVGNFGIISNDPTTHVFGFNEFSIVAHNIILEFISGMGVLGLTFAYWFVDLVKGLSDGVSKSNLLIRSLIIAFAINFFFDFTYFVPTMLWGWFSLLGLSEIYEKE